MSVAGCNDILTDEISSMWEPPSARVRNRHISHSKSGSLPILCAIEPSKVDQIDVPGPRFGLMMPAGEQTPTESADDTTISFRRYEPEDLLECARMAEDAWPAGSVMASKELELSGMEGYMRYSLGSANWTDIACTSEGVVGFLFGRIDNYHGATMPKRSPLGEVPMILRSSLENGQMTPGHLRFLWNLVLTELKLRLKAPRSDASVEMFIVGSEHRGKGIGTALIERFLRAARDVGSSLVTLYTDDKMSDWQFYEKRGFRRVGTFYDNITSHYSGLDAHGIIFAMDLKED